MNTFCVLPWMHFATNASGNLRICCNSIPGKNFILKEDGTPYKLWRDDLQDAWNSETYQTIRKQLLRGERPDMCMRCFREEDSGIKSARQSFNNRWMRDNEIYDENPDMNIRYVDLRLGNLCNLKCRMCNPYASNQWVDEWNSLGYSLDSKELFRLKNMKWPVENKTWENLFALVETIEEIYLTGGEPTIIKEQEILLDHVIDRKMAGDVKLKYNTNLTNIPRGLIEKWKKFRRIQLNCSIDGIGAFARYIRYPSHWSKIEENFLKMGKIDNVHVDIHCTVQIYNALHLHELIQWSLPHQTRIFFNILNHPEELNIRVLPEHIKTIVADNLKPYINMERVSGIIDYMEKEDWSDKLPRFYEYTSILDQSRDQSCKELIPELYQ